MNAPPAAMVSARAAAPARTVFRSARLLDPASGLDQPGSLLIEGGRIADFGPRLFAEGVPEDVAIVECDGVCLAPGLIDMRVQLRDPGEEHKETIATATAAAAAGGITTLVALPNSEPPIDDVAVVEFIARRAREAKHVKVFCYGAITRKLEGKQLVEMGMLQQSGVLGFTDGVRAIADARVMRRALAYSQAFDALILQHPEEPSLADGGAMNESEISTRLGLPGIPAAAEVIMVERDLRLVELTGARYHAAHLSTAEAIEAIRRAKARGLHVTCDTAPPYFALNETAVGEYRTFAKLSPPLRREADRLAVIEGLRDGTIDAIASDHAPQDRESKRVPFVQAEFGIVGLETLLVLALELYHSGKLPLLAALSHLTANPAALLGLSSGKLERGRAADLVLFELDRPGLIDVTSFRSKSKNSPFDGRPIQGRVRRTVVDGRTLFSAD
jgi:dihydroorotase